MDIVRGRTLLARAALIVAGGALLGACASSPTPPVSSVVPIVLKAAPSDMGCEIPAIPFKYFTIRIDAFADDQVWAVTDTLQRMDLLWDRGFIGGTSANPVVIDQFGQVVARDGERVDVSGPGPELHGNFVCPVARVNKIYIFSPAAPD